MRYIRQHLSRRTGILSTRKMYPSCAISALFSWILLHSTGKASVFCCGIRDNNDYQLPFNITITSLEHHCVSNQRQLDAMWNHCGFFPNNAKGLQIITSSWYRKTLYWDITNLFRDLWYNILHIWELSLVVFGKFALKPELFYLSKKLASYPKNKITFRKGGQILWGKDLTNHCTSYILSASPTAISDMKHQKVR